MYGRVRKAVWRRSVANRKVLVLLDGDGSLSAGARVSARSDSGFVERTQSFENHVAVHSAGLRTVGRLRDGNRVVVLVRDVRDRVRGALTLCEGRVDLSALVGVRRRGVGRERDLGRLLVTVRRVSSENKDARASSAPSSLAAGRLRLRWASTNRHEPVLRGHARRGERCEACEVHRRPRHHAWRSGEPTSCRVDPTTNSCRAGRGCDR